MIVEEALKEIGQAILNPDGGRFSLRSVLDRTGAYFFACRVWRFTRQMRGMVRTVAGSPYVTLPPGMIRLISMELDRADVSTTGRIILSDPSVFTAARAIAPESGDYLACEEWKDNRRRLALHRAAEESAEYVAAYEVGWDGTCGYALDKEELPIPTFAVPAFQEMLHAYALGLEEPSGGTVSERLSEVLAGPVFAAAVRTDAAAVPSSGPMLKTWVSRDPVRDADIGTINYNLQP